MPIVTSQMLLVCRHKQRHSNTVHNMTTVEKACPVGGRCWFQFHINLFNSISAPVLPASGDGGHIGIKSGKELNTPGPNWSKDLIIWPC